jgi:hypothetical protein
MGAEPNHCLCRVAVRGIHTEIILPTGRSVTVFLPRASDATTARAFAQRYLNERCAYDRDFELVVVHEVKFEIRLPSPLPAISAAQPGSLLLRLLGGEAGVDFRWKWPGRTPLTEVFAEVAALLRIRREDLEFDFPEDDPIIRYFFQRRQIRRPLLVTQKHRSVTKHLRFASNEWQVEVSNADQVLQLRETAFQWLSGLGVITAIQRSDLVLSLDDQVLPDGTGISSLGDDPIVITVPAVVSVRFKYETGADRPQVFERTFGLAATIKDGEEYVSGQIERSPDKIILFHAGRELQDTQRLSRLRLQPDSFVMVWVDELTPVLIQSMKCLRIAPRPINFKVLESGDEFQIEFLGGDLIDHVRVRVANRLERDPTQAQLRFAEHELQDDVMIDAIGLGDEDFIGIHIRSPDVVQEL